MAQGDYNHNCGRVYCLVFNPTQNYTVLYRVDTMGIPISDDNPIEMSVRGGLLSIEEKEAEEFLEKFYGGKYAVKDFLEETLEKHNKQTEKFGIVDLDHWDPFETRDYTKEEY